ncbi:MAG: hypothetical protein MJ066_03565 [Clostridia bacterium]|nr:hypothetical protein [Clostridia bacterium]
MINKVRKVYEEPEIRVIELPKQDVLLGSEDPTIDGKEYEGEFVGA